MFEANTYENLYPFGHGLSYTKFEYSELTLNSSSVKPPSGIAVQVTITNVGSRSGKEAVLVYLNDEYASVSRPVKQLKAFKKIQLEPRESKTLTFELSLDDMSFVNFYNARVYEPGKFNIFIADKKASFNLTL